MGAAALEADDLLGPRLVVLSVRQGEASSIRSLRMTKVGRRKKKDGSISRDEISAVLKSVLLHMQIYAACWGPEGGRLGWGFPERREAVLKYPLASRLGRAS